MGVGIRVGVDVEVGAVVGLSAVVRLAAGVGLRVAVGIGDGRITGAEHAANRARRNEKQETRNKECSLFIVEERKFAQ